MTGALGAPEFVAADATAAALGSAPAATDVALAMSTSRRVSLKPSSSFPMAFL